MTMQDPGRFPTSPAVDVIIPCYNAGHLISDAIQSILSQKGRFALRDIIVGDDCSDDETTPRVLSEWTDQGKIRVVRLDSRQGPAQARNVAAAAGQAPWLAFLDADDILTPGSLDARFAALEHFPDAQWVGGDFDVVDEETGTVEHAVLANRRVGEQYIKPALAQNCPAIFKEPFPIYIDSSLCHTCSIIISRQAFSRVGGFDVRLMRQQDYNFFLKLAIYYDFVFTPEVVMYYRRRKGTWVSQGRLLNWRISACLFLLEHEESRKFSKDIIKKAERCCRQAYWEARNLGSITESVRFLLMEKHLMIKRILARRA